MKELYKVCRECLATVRQKKSSATDEEELIHKLRSEKCRDCYYYSFAYAQIHALEFSHGETMKAWQEAEEVKKEAEEAHRKAERFDKYFFHYILAALLVVVILLNLLYLLLR
jgi:uncharacterized coiled-coil DUF342 family protein